jgi:hypothetical protein
MLQIVLIIFYSRQATEKQVDVTGVSEVPSHDVFYTFYGGYRDKVY